MLYGLLVVLIVVIIGVAIYVAYRIYQSKVYAAQQKLLHDALGYLKITENQMDIVFGDYQKAVTVKSRQTLEKYDYSSFFKANREYFDIITDFLLAKEKMINNLKVFLKSNPFQNEKQYPFLKGYLNSCIASGCKYIIRVRYISSAGNCLGTRDFTLTLKTVKDIENTPELYMTKTEMREIEKDKVELKKKDAYSKVSKIIDKANELKDNLITKNEVKTLDNLIANLFDRTVNSIQKIKQLESDEWNLIGKVIKDVESDVNDIEKKNNGLRNYYSSRDFDELKKTCNLLMNSQKDFNAYVEEKIRAISKMFGTRITRNETEHEDVYNYVRTYNKTISPFTAELSSAVFGSAENNPIQYLIKYFYPNKSMYKEQIIDLKNLLNELEALKDAKVIIDNYKKDYAQYIANVPSYVLEEDEDGFYSRLGFAVIDENVLNVEYKFVYTSNGGMAQRSFAIPMTEETISELISQLQSKLSTAALAKEQRALMTPNLRLTIKERDNYTCCICGNSTHVEPNLLLEIDHKIPIAKGGLTVEDNLQTLCWKCNRNKGAKLI